MGDVLSIGGAFCEATLSGIIFCLKEFTLTMPPLGHIL